MPIQKYSWTDKVQSSEGERGFFWFLLCMFALAILLFAIQFF